MKTNPLLFHGKHIFLRDPINIEKKMESIINKGEILCFDNELFSRLKVYYQTQCYVFKMIRLLFNWMQLLRCLFSSLHHIHFIPIAIDLKMYGIVI